MHFKKLFALVMILAFGLQSCSKGVSPTPNAGDINPTSTQNDIAKKIKEVLCLEEGDEDSDGDGICDSEDKTDDGYDCSNDDKCIDGEHPDEYVHPEKSKWWLTTGIIAVGAAGATLAVKKSTGDWWWNDIIKDKPDADEGIFVVATDKEGNIKVDSTEEFWNVGGEVYNLYKVKMAATNGYNLTNFEGGKVGKGENIIICIKSTFGYAQQSSTTFKATYYLGDYQKSDYVKAITGQGHGFSEEAVYQHCNEKGGAFLGLQDIQNGGNYTIYPIPSRLLNSSKAENLNNPAMDVNYVFKVLPASITSSTEIKYYRQNVDFTDNISVDYTTKISDSDQITYYNNCTTNDCRASVVFGSLTGTPAVESKPDPVQLQKNIDGYNSTLKAPSEVFDNCPPGVKCGV